MRIWLDTTNVEMVRKAVRMGLLFGVTTNPSLIAQAGKPIKQTLQDLLDVQDGPVTAQVVAEDVHGMVEQGLDFYDFSDRLIIKVPVTEEGYEAIHFLVEQEVPTMATVVFHPHQALIAAQAGAMYVAPYLYQMEKNGFNPWEALASMMQIFHNYLCDTEILAASIYDLEYVQKVAEAGIPHITLKDTLFHQLIATDPLTKERVKHFASLSTS